MTRKILLTGCTRGLGRALVDRFVEQGHQVAGCGRNAEILQQMSAQFNSPHHFEQIDVTDSDQVQRWQQQLQADGFVPDLLINNAGVINRPAALWELTDAEFQQIVDVNLCGIANMLRAFLSAMIERQTGVIINLSSGWGRSVSAEVAPYCATKWGVEGLTKALAEELPPGLAAIPLNPGIINTDMLQQCFGEAANHHPTADEWSHQAAKLLLSLNESHNGSSLTV